MPFRVDPNFTRALPKAELHAHLSGSISRQTLHEIWVRKQSNKQCLDLEDPLTAIKPGGEGFVDVVTFFPLFDKYIYNLCNEVESVQYATEQVLKDFAVDGVRYLELRTTPRECVDTGMTRDDYVEAVNGVLHRWNQSHAEALEVYLILSIDRKMTIEQAMDVVDVAIDHQHRPDDQPQYVVALDLCGDPTKGDVSVFTPAFQKAREHTLGITIHFAELPQSSIDSELSTILSWSPDRLGHCIHVSPRFKAIINERAIGLEMCLSCNVLAKLSIGGFGKHHFGEWLQSDCPIALSTDDVGIFGSPLSNEYSIAAEYFLGLREDLIRLSKMSMSVAFAGRQRMKRLIDEFEQKAHEI